MTGLQILGCAMLAVIPIAIWLRLAREAGAFVASVVIALGFATAGFVVLAVELSKGTFG